MKDYVNIFGWGAAMGLGYYTGVYLWENWIEDAIDDFREYLHNKKRKEAGV